MTALIFHLAVQSKRRWGSARWYSSQRSVHAHRWV